MAVKFAFGAFTPRNFEELRRIVQEKFRSIANAFNAHTGDSSVHFKVEAGNGIVVDQNGDIVTITSIGGGIPDSGSESLRYIYVATQNNVPAPNFLHLNNSDPALVTEIYLSTTSYPNRSVSNILELLSEGDALYLQQSSDDDRFINANITGAAVDNGVAFAVPIEIVSSGDPFDPNVFTNIIVYHAGGGGGGPQPEDELKNPVFSYDDGLLSRVDYDSGANKVLSYDSNSILQQLVFTNGSTIQTKGFVYNPDGTLASITET